MNNFNYASIDIGSNSINLMLAYVKNNQIIDQQSKSYITGLGKGLRESGLFSDEGISNAMEALIKIRETLNIYKIPKANVISVATEASRVAKNSREFYEQVSSRIDIDVQIIDSRQEALYSALGAIPAKIDESLVLDLGGASTEVIHFKNKNIESYKSFQIGSVNVSQDFNFSDVDQFISKVGFRQRLILVGGTAVVFSIALLNEMGFCEAKINSSTFDMLTISECNESLQRFERNKLVEEFPFMESRMDSIQIGIFRIVEFLKIIKPNSVSFSTYGVRQGALKNSLGDLGQL